MSRLEVGTGVGATRFNPTDFAYSRTTKEGDIPVITYLLGSHFNEAKDGLVTQSQSTNLENPSIVWTGGKMELAGDSSTSGTSENLIATHSTFTYFFPKTNFNGNAELQDEQVGEFTPNVKFIERMRTEFEDLGTGDKLTLDLDSGNSVAGTNAEFLVKETRGGVETTLATFVLPSGEKSIDWKVKYLDEGVTKVLYKTASGVPTVLFKGDLTAELTECKITQQLVTDIATPTKTVKTDFLWCFYPAIYSGYDTPPKDKDKAIVKIFDTMGTEVEANWQRVFAKDHFFDGDRVFENGLFRMRFKTTPEIECSGWNVANVAWEVIGSIIPTNNTGAKGSVLHDVIIDSFNDSQVRLIAKFGIVDYIIYLKKAMPYARIRLQSKTVTFQTTKERFALSNTITPDTNLTDYNQKNSDDTNKGNPLNLASPENISVFTEGTDTDRGLDFVNDNWFAFYNLSVDDMVGFIGTALIPKAIDLEATSSTVLKEARFTFKRESIICVGILEGDPTAASGGVPSVFNPGIDDTYVKWRANAGIFVWRQEPFMRKKR